METSYSEAIRASNQFNASAGPQDVKSSPWTEQEIPLSNLSAMWFQRYNCAADVKMMVEPTPHSDVPFVGHARARLARDCARLRARLNYSCDIYKMHRL